MKLNKTIENLRNSNKSFFNLKKGDVINFDLLKSEIKFYMNIDKIVYNWKKEKLLRYVSDRFSCYYTVNKYGDYYPYVQINELIMIEEIFFMRLVK